MKLIVDWIKDRQDITTRVIKLRCKTFLGLLERVEGVYMFSARIKGSPISHWLAFNAWAGVIYVGFQAGVVVLDEEDNAALRERRALTKVNEIWETIGLESMNEIYVVCEVL